ncbi:MAG TPA: hypothetical protein PK360_14555 [bacterium]|nr:hypothetical protein [bacterium]
MKSETQTVQKMLDENGVETGPLPKEKAVYLTQAMAREQKIIHTYRWLTWTLWILAVVTFTLRNPFQADAGMGRGLSLVLIASAVLSTAFWILREKTSTAWTAEFGKDALLQKILKEENSLRFQQGINLFLWIIVIAVSLPVYLWIWPSMMTGWSGMGGIPALLPGVQAFLTVLTVIGVLLPFAALSSTLLYVSRSRAHQNYNLQYRLAGIEDKLGQNSLRERLEALEEKVNRLAERIGTTNSPPAP